MNNRKIQCPKNKSKFNYFGIKLYVSDYLVKKKKSLKIMKIFSFVSHFNLLSSSLSISLCRKQQHQKVVTKNLVNLYIRINQKKKYTLLSISSNNFLALLLESFCFQKNIPLNAPFASMERFYLSLIIKTAMFCDVSMSVFEYGIFVVNNKNAPFVINVVNNKFFAVIQRVVQYGIFAILDQGFLSVNFLLLKIFYLFF